MKKLHAVITCVIIALVFAVQPAIAQDDALTFGVKGGLNLSDISIDPDEGSTIEAATNFGVGGIILYPISEVLDLQIEAMYLLKGAKDGASDLTLNFTYISVPVMGRYNLGSGDISPYIAAGPEFGFLLSADFEFEGETIDIKDDLKSIDLGINVGAGVSIESGSMPMFAEVRYSLGLADINDDPDDPDTSLKTTGIQLFVGVMF